MTSAIVQNYIIFYYPYYIGFIMFLFWSNKKNVYLNWIQKSDTDRLNY